MSELAFEPHEAASLVKAMSALTPGTRVRLAPGRFALPGPLVIATSVELVGEPSKTVLDGQRAQPIIVINGGEAVAIRGIDFEQGLGMWGGAISSGVKVRLNIDQCRFANNRAHEDGGAVFLRNAMKSRIVRCTFEESGARRAGGGLAIGSGDVLVDRCVFRGNEAQVGGGVFLSGTAALELRNCTLFGNRATVVPGGAGLFVQGARSSGPSAYVANTVFAGADAIAGDPATKLDVYFAHCIVSQDALAQHPGFRGVKPNTLGEPTLVQIAPGAWGLAPGSPGTHTADAGRIEEGATDALGVPLVRDGVADPGAFSHSRSDMELQASKR